MSQSIYLGNTSSANFNGNNLGAINLNGSEIWAGAWTATGTLECNGFKPKNKPQQWNYNYNNNRLGDTNVGSRGSLSPDIQQDGLLVQTIGINTKTVSGSTSIYLRLARTDLSTQAALDFTSYSWPANTISKFTINGYDLHVPIEYSGTGNPGYQGLGLGSGVQMSPANGLVGIVNRSDGVDFGHNMFSVEYYWLLGYEYGRPSQMGLTEGVGTKNMTIGITKR